MKHAILLLSLIGFIVGCSEKRLIEHTRDEAFFTKNVNTSEKFAKAEKNLNDFKLLVTSDVYNMRYALFDNGKFYYQVDKLGNGEGTWTYKEGFLKLHASRSFFDMNLNLVATEATGDGMALQFLDRHGLNHVKVEVKDPSSQALPAFTAGKHY